VSFVPFVVVIEQPTSEMRPRKWRKLTEVGSSPDRFVSFVPFVVGLRIPA